MSGLVIGTPYRSRWQVVAPQVCTPEALRASICPSGLYVRRKGANNFEDMARRVHRAGSLATGWRENPVHWHLFTVPRGRFVESASVCISLSYYAFSRSGTYRSRLYHGVVEVVGVFSRPFMWVTHPSDSTMRDVGAPAPRVVLGVIYLAAPHPVLNGSSPHDLVEYTRVPAQWVLFEVLARLQQVTARHIFGEVQHMTHDLGLQGEWIHLCDPSDVGGQFK